MSHTPVLLNEVIHYLDPKPGDLVIDGTVDGGGHAEAILERIGSRGTLFGVDWDRAQIEHLQKKMQPRKNVLLARGNYKDLPTLLSERNLGKANGLLLDLGFSSVQIEASGRGFSFMKDEPLLMTYDDTKVPVRELLKRMKEEEIAKVLHDYGGERFARRIARALYSRERHSPVTTTSQLVEVVLKAMPGRSKRWGGIHPATRTFQALRIHANDELENLQAVLAKIPDILLIGGRAVIISFHSLEDRIVKLAFRDMQREGIIEVITKKPVSPSREEIKENPRSRSAKLRACKVL